MNDLVSNLIFCVLVVYQVTSIVTQSLLFKYFRESVSKKSKILGALLSCFLCTSVWISFIYSGFFWSPLIALSLKDVHIITRIFLDGMFISCIVWFMYVLEIKLTRVKMV